MLCNKNKQPQDVVVSKHQQAFNDRQRKRLEFMESVFMRPLDYNHEIPFEMFITNSASNMTRVDDD